MLFEIKSRLTGDTLFRRRCGSFRQCVKAASKVRANLSGADLSGADLLYLDLSGLDLTYADLSGAILYNANLCGADLSGAILCNANLYGADLSSVELCDANLCGANLCGANLCGANLCGADLSSANLSSANLCGADLCGANLCGAKGTDLIFARQRIVPDGTLVAWKKLRDGVIAQLEIPNDAQRVNAIGSRGCRSSAAVVVALFKDGVLFYGEAYDMYSWKLRYKAGEIVIPDAYDDSVQTECSHGIHWFLTREEAEAC